MGDKMETISARLASFDAVGLPSINSRASSSQNVHRMAWPYDSPSPEQLAQAGFFFNPYDTNPDNTTCFLCRRALDGWEEGDDPLTEHLRLSPDCGWAILMDINQNTSNPAEIEDPTSVAIVEARRATFAVGWPHDSKSGWACQSDKMVEAGWYFCPTDDSPDLASCPYCKLSLDGWEETDDPFEEHHRRSADCSFFVFALPAAKPAKKATRSKKPRVSKASSRLSTQSVMTTASEAPTIEDDMMDMSVMSQTTAKKTKGTKKTTRSRAKKAKKEESVEVEEQPEEKALEPEKPKRATRGTKRGSQAVTQDFHSVASSELDMAPDVEEPLSKRRATEMRRSISQQPDDMEMDYPDDIPVDVATSPVMPKKGRKGAKKGAATKTRKTSTASSSGRAAKGKVPDDSVLDAAIEADLARDIEEPEPFEFHYKDEKRESARFREQSLLDSTELASIENQGNEVHKSRGKNKIKSQNPDFVPGSETSPEVAAEPSPEPKTKKSSKRKVGTKKSKKEKAQSQNEPGPEPEFEPQPELVEEIHSESDSPMHAEQLDAQSRPKKQLLEDTMEAEHSSRHGSVMAREIESIKSQSESEPESVQPPAKKQGRKTAKKGKKRAASDQTVEDLALHEEQDDAASFDAQTALRGSTKPRANNSKRKTEEADEDITIVDQSNRALEDAAPGAVVEQPQPKAKRGRPPKNSQLVSQDEKQAVEAKPKRGRPSKQQTTQYASRAEPEIDGEPKPARLSNAKLPAKNTQRYSDLPRDRHRAQSFIEFVAQEMSSSPTHTQETTDPRKQERTPSPSPQSSDAENRPPSTRPRSARPPIASPSKTRVHLAASTPTRSPSKRQADTGYLSSTTSWQPMDIDELLASFGNQDPRDMAINHTNLKEILTSPEKKMTVEEWINFNAKNGEERLKQECERLISVFEREGGRAMRALEGIECID